jgi:hypothetical protein
MSTDLGVSSDRMVGRTRNGKELDVSIFSRNPKHLSRSCRSLEDLAIPDSIKLDHPPTLVLRDGFW